MGDSIQAYLASRHAFDQLVARLDGSANEFAAYVAARWLDGAGKCQYRVSRYREALRLFEKGYELAQRHDLWWVIPDLSSNRLRARQEAARVAAGGVWNAGAKESFQEQLHGIELEFKKALAASTQVSRAEEISYDAEYQITLSASDEKHREFLRGCSSLLHNFSIILGSDNSESLKYSGKSAAICRSLNDHYRLGQALNQQQIVKRGLAETREQARTIIEEMLNGKWRRGKQIARQAKAYLDSLDRNNHERALSVFKELLDEVNASRQSRDSEFGLDLDFPNYTLNFAAGILRDSNLGQEKATDQLTWSEYVAEERLKNVRSLRRVVTISEDKFTYTRRTVQPAYWPEIEKLNAKVKALRSDKDEAESIIDELISLVEESTSREILDLIGLNRHLPKSPKQVSDRFKKIEATGDVSDPTEAGTAEQKLSRKPLDAAAVERASKRAEEYSQDLLARPMEVEEIDPDIGERLRLLAASQQDLCIIRYFRSSSPTLYALIVMNAVYRVIPVCGYSEIEDLRKRLVAKADEGNAPDFNDCGEIFNLALDPIFELLEQEAQRRPSELMIIPTGLLFELPLHVAWLAKKRGPLADIRGPLAAFFPLVFAVSVNSLLRDARFLLRRQFVDANDDLCAMIVGGQKDNFGHEISNLEWPQEHFFVAGTRPAGKLSAHKYWQPNGEAHPATREAFEALCKTQPEFLVYSGHGHYGEKRQDLPVLLELRTAESEDDYLSELDIAARVQLRRNKLTVISACVAGLGVSRHEGEVAGFVRSFMAAGCGLLGLALWPVFVNEVERSTNALLRGALDKMKQHSTVDIPSELRNHYQRRKEGIKSNQEWINACPLVLYI